MSFSPSLRRCQIRLARRGFLELELILSGFASANESFLIKNHKSFEIMLLHNDQTLKNALISMDSVKTPSPLPKSLRINESFCVLHELTKGPITNDHTPL